MKRVRQIQKELNLSRAKLNQILLELGEDIEKYYSNYRIDNEVLDKIRKHVHNKKIIESFDAPKDEPQLISRSDKKGVSNTITSENNIAHIKEQKIAASSKSKKANFRSLKEEKLKIDKSLTSSKKSKRIHEKLINKNNAKKKKKKKFKRSSFNGNIISNSNSQVKRFKSVFINSNLSIGEILKSHGSINLLEDFISLDPLWNKETRISEKTFSKYYTELLHLFAKMGEQPKYKSKHRGHKNYGKIILGGRGG